MADINKGDGTNPKNKSFPYMFCDKEFQTEELKRLAMAAITQTEELCTKTVPFPAKEVYEGLKMPLMFSPVLRVDMRSGAITTIDYEDVGPCKKAAEKPERNGKKHKKKNSAVSNGKHNKKRKKKVARSTKYTNP